MVLAIVWSKRQIHLITFPIFFTLFYTPHLLIYEGSQTTIEHLAVYPPEVTPQTLPSSPNSIFSMSVFNIKVPLKMKNK